jgi:hypothetical protein
MHFGLHPLEHIPLLVHLWKEISRKPAIPQIWHQVAAGIGKEPWSLMVKNAEEAREQEVVIALNTCVSEGKGTPQRPRVEEASNPSRYCAEVLFFEELT